MEEKFQVVGPAFASLVALGVLFAVTGACSSEGSTFGSGGTANNPSNGGSGNPTAGTNGNPMGGSGNPTGGSGNPTGGSGNPTGGSGNPTGGSGNPTGGSGGGETAVGGSGGSPPAEPCPKPEGEVCHEFFANDNARNQINYVNEFKIGQMVDGKVIDAGGVIWTVPVGVTGVNSPRQVEMVDNVQATNGKAIMVSVNTGYKEYDMITGDELVNRTQLGVTDIRGAIRLANGDTILGVGNDKLRTFNSAGQQVGTECTLPGAGGDSLRVLNRDPATGNLLLGRLLDVFIVNVQCQQQWTAKLPAGGKAYSVLPRMGGGVYATSGAPSTVVEYDMGGQIVSQVGGKAEHPGLGLDFFSGFEILPNGNFVAANWQGHIAAPAEDTPHLVEFTPTNELVWKWGNQTLARQITNTLMLR
jgi:hypothetical protein